MITAVSAGFLSRAEIGLAKPKSISRNITPEHGGVAFHHGGASVPIFNHASCVATWKVWQRFHMGRNHPVPQANGRHWVDIAYTLAVCQHGYVFAGRGANVRTAANGTNYGNQNFYAVVWLGGAAQTPTASALSALLWAVAELRKSGAGMRVLGHNDLKSTACPHPHLTELARKYDRKYIDQGERPRPPQIEDEVDYDKIKGIVSDLVGPVQKKAEEAVSGIRLIKTRTNENVRLSEAAVEAQLVSLRRELDMTQSPESDAKQIEYLRNGRGGEKYRWHDAERRIREAAAKGEDSVPPTDEAFGHENES